MDLEKRVEILERKVAALEGLVQEQPVTVKIKITNLDDLNSLILETNENIKKIKNFKLTSEIVE